MSSTIQSVFSHLLHSLDPDDYLLLPHDALPRGSPHTWSWNHHDSVLCGLPRSSNIAEGWHNGFKSLIACANPTMWRFLDCLKLEQAISDTKITRHLNRDPPPRRAAKWIRWDERVDKVVNEYDTYADTMDFLKVVAAMI